MVIGYKKRFVEPIKAGTKKHTVREDKHNRWRAGLTMHMATGIRSKYYNCFNQTHCTGTQPITMHMEKDDDGGLSVLVIKVNGKRLDDTTINSFVVADGFKDLHDFKKWWLPELAVRPAYTYTGKIIHWTDLRY